MKVKRILQRAIRRRRKQKTGVNSVHSFVVLTACALLAVVIAVGTKVLNSNDDHNQVYAASESEDSEVSVSPELTKTEVDDLPTGIAGVVTGVQEPPAAGSTVERIGTSCEKVMVGQREKMVEGGATEFNVSPSLERTVNDWDSQTITLAETPKMMSDTDYDTLLSIVEAEAGGEDLKGRILVANVIMNRVAHQGFPNTVTEVVWEYDANGVPQFSPTYDGRIGEVTVSDETTEAVKEALEGTDYSQGALFFIEKAAAEEQNVTWFEKDLKKLFKYGVHDFYTYPDDVDINGEKKTEESGGDGVSMVKNDILE